MTIKYQLKDGSIVEAKQDCGCVIHTGPHWVHMDEFDKARNLRMLEAMGGHEDPIARERFAQYELIRLRAKKYNFELRNISRIIREEANVDASA